MIGSEQRYEWLNRTDFGDLGTVIWCGGTKPEQVMAAYGMKPDTFRRMTLDQACDPDSWDELDDESESVLLVAELGQGSVAMHTSGYVEYELLRRLAVTGPCLSTTWSDFCPPIVTYLNAERPPISFSYISWSSFPEPDLPTVEQWIEASPPGRQGWLDMPGLAMLLTGESICSGIINEAWMGREHLARPLGDVLGTA